MTTDHAQLLTHLEQLLEQLTSANADSARIRAATATLKSQFFSKPTCIPALTELVQNSRNAQVRQLAAVELRKRAATLWMQVDEAAREQIKRALLQCILQEPENLVRHSTARVISTIAKSEVPAQRWNDLVQFLHSCCQAPTAGHREVGYYVLFTLFDVIGDFFAEHVQDLLGLFARGLQDPESKHVRVTTLQALGRLSDYIEPENKADVVAFCDLVPIMVGVIQHCLNENDAESANLGFEVFDGLLVNEAPFLSKYIAEIVDFFLSTAADRSLDETVRCMALNVLMMTIVYQKTKVQRLKLVIPIISRIFPVAAEEDPEDPDEDIPSRLAIQTIDYMSTNLPPPQVIPIVIDHVVTYMRDTHPNCRKAAMLVLAVLAEGSAEYVSSRFEELLPLIQQGLRDPADIVRKAACLALVLFSEEIPDEICSNHATLLPLVLNLISDPNESTKKHACNALDALLEGLADDIITYLQPLMEKLVGLMDVAQGDLKTTVIGAIGSAAHAAGEKFLPYFADVMLRLQHLMINTNTSDHVAMSHRGVATDTAATVAEAVGKEAFRPYLADTMNRAAEGLHLESASLRECSYCFFSVIARVYGSEFAPYLEHIIPHLLKSCQLDESLALDPVARAEASVLAAREADEVDVEGEDEDDEEERTFNISSAICDEKEIAADALGELFEALGADYLPYVSSTVEQLVNLSGHHGENVRKNAVTSLIKYLKTFHKLSHDPKWVPGLPVRIPVHENVESMIRVVIPAVLKMWKDEDDKKVFMQVCTDLADVIKLIGPAVVGQYMEEIGANCVDVFDKKVLCQLEPVDEEEHVDEEEQAEQDSQVISSASELVGALAKVVGENFAPYMKVLFPKVAKYYKKTMSTSDRAMAIGCLSECAEGMGRAVTEYTSELFRLLERALDDEAGDVRSNAAFGVGVLVQNSGHDLSSHYPTLLSKLYPLFSNQSSPNVTDNACGAVARMILRYPAAIPLDQVLPVFLQALPLRADYLENESVFKCLFQLFQANNVFVFANLPRMLSVFAAVLSDQEQLTQEIRDDLVNLLRHLSATNGSFGAALSSVPADVQQAIVRTVQTQ